MQGFCLNKPMHLRSWADSGKQFLQVLLKMLVKVIGYFLKQMWSVFAGNIV